MTNEVVSRKWTRAVLCAAALVTPLAVSGCHSTASTAEPGSTTSAAASPTSASTAAGASSTASSTASSAAAGASSSASAATSPSSAALNATAGTGLTVSDGGSKILMNGKAVDFGTEVHDPAWSADGKRVLFIDGDGNLSVADADGTGREVLARNPGGQTWSHPTWQVLAAGQFGGIPARAAYLFASTAGGTTTLWEVGTAPNAQPRKLPLDAGPGKSVVRIPQTDDTWPSAGGKQGTAVFENDHGDSADIYVRDDNLREVTGLSIKDGSEPDFVVTGASKGGAAEIVFVRAVGGHKHIFEQAVYSDTSQARDLTPNATTDCTEPALSPDGKTVAFSTPSGVQSVSADGSGSPTQITNTPGFPAYRTGS